MEKNINKVCAEPKKYEDILIETLRREEIGASKEELAAMEKEIHDIMGGENA